MSKPGRIPWGSLPDECEDVRFVEYNVIPPGTMAKRYPRPFARAYYPSGYKKGRCLQIRFNDGLGQHVIVSLTEGGIRRLEAVLRRTREKGRRLKQKAEDTP